MNNIGKAGNILPGFNRAMAGLTTAGRERLAAFRTSYAQRVGILNFSALFTDEAAELMGHDRRFLVQVFNPIGGVNLPKMTDRIVEFYEKRRIDFRIFNDGINRVVLVPGLARREGLALTAQLKADLKTSGFSANAGAFEYDRSVSSLHRYNPTDIMNAVLVCESELRRVNSDYIQTFALSNLLANRKPVEHKAEWPTPERLEAVREFLENPELQEMTLRLPPDELRAYIRGKKIRYGVEELAVRWNADIYIDRATGLLNRAAYAERLQTLQREGKNYALAEAAVEGIERWDSLNGELNTIGAEMRDELFKDFTERLEDHLKRAGITAGLYATGGGKLGIIFEGAVSKDDAEACMRGFWEEIREAKLLKRIRPEWLSISGRSALTRYLYESRGSINPDGTITVNLYRFLP